MDIEQLNSAKRQSQTSSFMATERLRQWFGFLLPQFSMEASLSPSSSSPDLLAPSTYGSIISRPSATPGLNNISAFNENDEDAFPPTHKLRLKLVHLGKFVNASTLFTLAMGVLLFSCLAIGSFNVSRGGGVIKAEPFPNLYNVAYEHVSAATEKAHDEDKDEQSHHDHVNSSDQGSSSNATSAKHASQPASDDGNDTSSPKNASVTGSSMTSASSPVNPAATPTVVANIPPPPSTNAAPPLSAEQAAVIARQAADRAAAVATAAAARNTEENLRAQALAAEAARRAEASAEENAKARAKASEKVIAYDVITTRRIQNFLSC
eukprot:jgi/Bigna1/128023/aug1.5_g2731